MKFRAFSNWHAQENVNNMLSDGKWTKKKKNETYKTNLEAITTICELNTMHLVCMGAVDVMWSNHCMERKKGNIELVLNSNENWKWWSICLGHTFMALHALLWWDFMSINIRAIPVRTSPISFLLYRIVAFMNAVVSFDFNCVPFQYEWLWLATLVAFVMCVFDF